MDEVLEEHDKKKGFYFIRTKNFPKMKLLISLDDLPTEFREQINKKSDQASKQRKADKDEKGSTCRNVDSEAGKRKVVEVTKVVKNAVVM